MICEFYTLSKFLKRAYVTYVHFAKYACVQMAMQFRIY